MSSSFFQKQKERILQVYKIEKSSIPLLDTNIPYKDILKFLDTIPHPSLLQKSSHTSGLVQRKVAIKKKDGSTYYAIRWVDPTTEQSKPLSHPKYSKEGNVTQHEDEKVQDIHDSEHLSANEKVRKLAGLGIYDKNHLANLSGHKYPGDLPSILKKEVNVDSKEFKDDSCELPSKKSTSSEDLSKPEVQFKAVSQIAEEFGGKKAFEYQKKIKNEVMEKYGITVDDKWEGYEDDLNMLLDGHLGLRAVMGYGTGGIGKTYTLEAKIFPGRKMIEYDAELDMESGGEEYDYVKIGGKIGSKEVQRKMYEHRNKILVFDDCDSMWDDPGVINVLKNALDTSGKGKTQWAMSLPESEKGKGDTVPTSFTFGGRMIFITNLTKEELVQKGAAAVVESRCASSDLTMNLEQTLDRLDNIAPYVKVLDENRNEIESVTLEDKQAAFKALREVSQFGRIDQINTRVLTQIIAKSKMQREKGKNDEERHDYLVKQVLKQFGY